MSILELWSNHNPKPKSLPEAIDKVLGNLKGSNSIGFRLNAEEITGKINVVPLSTPCADSSREALDTLSDVNGINGKGVVNCIPLINQAIKSGYAIEIYPSCSSFRKDNADFLGKVNRTCYGDVSFLLVTHPGQRFNVIIRGKSAAPMPQVA